MTKAYVSKNMEWTKKLTKTQVVHCLEMGMVDLDAVRRQAKHVSTQTFPCWDCCAIFRALDVDYELTAFNERLEKEAA